MASEHGPFDRESEALATRTAAAIRAAFDAAPGPGASVPERVAVLTEACAESGVDLGDLDRSVLSGIAWREVYDTVCVAGMIRRAATRGTAAQLVREALHLRANGEYAPGGTENWRDWERKAETFLRKDEEHG